MRIIISLLLLLAAFNLSQAQPVIHSFSPLTAPAGAVITIEGTGFSTVPGNNTVYFGAVKASVSTATDTSLTAVVPVGTLYFPISVTVNSLTSFSAFSFSQTFTEAIPVMSGSFEDKVDFAMPPFPLQTIARDFDGDGKTDLVVLNNQSTFSIFRNSSTPHTHSLEPKIDFPVISTSHSMECGDIDGDGRPDILVTSESNITVYRNTSTAGNTSFAAGINLPAAVDVTSLTLADVNGDGKTDVIANDQSTPFSFSVYKNRSTPGSIVFSAQTAIATGKYVGRIVARDLDGDLKPDLTVSVQDSIRVYKNLSDTGNLSFSYNGSFFTPEHLNISYADFNRDGKMDIALNTRTSVIILKNNAVGTNISFVTILSVPLPANNVQDFVKGLKVADFDGDGWPDISYMSQYATRHGLFVTRNQSNATTISFGSPVPFFVGLTSTSRNDLTVADMDNDEKPDLITTNESLRTLSIYLNKGNQPIISSITPATGSQGTLVTLKGYNFNNASAVRFGNVAATSFTLLSDTILTATAPAGQTGLIYVTNPFGDGRRDAFTYNIPAVTSVTPLVAKVGDSILISGSNFAADLTRNIVTMGATTCRVISATDNAIKIVVPHGSTRQPLTVTSNAATAFYDRAVLLPFEETGILASNSFFPAIFPATGSGSSGIFIADLNEDGKPDLLTPNYNSLSFSLLRNTSGANNNLSFAPKVDYAINSNANVAIAGDMNGDGKPELILADNFRGTIMKNSSTAGGSFNFTGGGATLYFDPSPYFPNDLTTGDFDRDGRPDIVVSAGNAKVISIFRNKSLNGDLAFYEKQDFGTNMKVWEVTPSDINNDGNTDLVTFSSGAGGHRMIFLKNTSPAGADRFTFDSTEFMLESFAHKIHMADIDGDGYKDLCVTSEPLNKFSVYRNLSNGTTIAFGPRIDFATDAGPRGVYADDVDGDGKMDIVSINSTARTISVFKGLSVPGTISFAPRVNYPVNDYPNDIFVGDLDADGRPEIVTANYSSRLTVFKNKVGLSDIVTLCPGGSISLPSNLGGANFKWQQRIGTQFVPIDDNTNYAGTDSSILQLNNLPSSFAGNEYSCLVDGNYSNIIKLSFQNTWTGTVNTNWEDPGNWSCGSVPDMYTDVVISSGNVLVNSNITIRSLTLNAPASITVTTGSVLTILR